jgi:hypothetical protein
MSFSPESPVTEDEDLYKALTGFQWSTKKNRPSSAAFKDEGSSVDRDGERELENIIDHLEERFDETYGIACVSADVCLNEAEGYVKADPLPDNPYHAEIYRSPEMERGLSRSPAVEIAKACEMIRLPERDR